MFTNTHINTHVWYSLYSLLGYIHIYTYPMSKERKNGRQQWLVVGYWDDPGRITAAQFALSSYTESTLKSWEHMWHIYIYVYIYTYIYIYVYIYSWVWVIIWNMYPNLNVLPLNFIQGVCPLENLDLLPLPTGMIRAMVFSVKSQWCVGWLPIFLSEIDGNFWLRWVNFDLRRFFSEWWDN